MPRKRNSIPRAKWKAIAVQPLTYDKLRDFQHYTRLKYYAIVEVASLLFEHAEIEALEDKNVDIRFPGFGRIQVRKSDKVEPTIELIREEGNGTDSPRLGTEHSSKNKRMLADRKILDQQR